MKRLLKLIKIRWLLNQKLNKYNLNVHPEKKPEVTRLCKVLIRLQDLITNLKLKS